MAVVAVGITVVVRRRRLIASRRRRRRALARNGSRNPFGAIARGWAAASCGMPVFQIPAVVGTAAMIGGGGIIVHGSSDYG
jgi:hypothetical protein